MRLDRHSEFFFSSEATVKIKPISGSTTIADSTVEVAVDPSVAGLGTTAESAVLEDTPVTTGETVMEEVITGAVMAGVDTREVVEGMELVTPDAEVGRVVGDETAVAAARLEAW